MIHIINKNKFNIARNKLNVLKIKAKTEFFCH